MSRSRSSHDATGQGTAQRGWRRSAATVLAGSAALALGLFVPAGAQTLPDTPGVTVPSTPALPPTPTIVPPPPYIATPDLPAPLDGALGIFSPLVHPGCSVTSGVGFAVGIGGVFVSIPPAVSNVPAYVTFARTMCATFPTPTWVVQCAGDDALGDATGDVPWGPAGGVGVDVPRPFETFASMLVAADDAAAASGAPPANLAEAAAATGCEVTDFSTIGSPSLPDAPGTPDAPDLPDVESAAIGRSGPTADSYGTGTGRSSISNAGIGSSGTLGATGYGVSSGVGTSAGSGPAAIGGVGTSSGAFTGVGSPASGSSSPSWVVALCIVAAAAGAGRLLSTRLRWDGSTLIDD